MEQSQTERDIESLCENPLRFVVIRCERRCVRALLHRYLRIVYGKLGLVARSMRDPRLICKRTPYHRCDCGQWSKMRPRDEYYRAQCENCREIYWWDPLDYDCLETDRRVRWQEPGNTIVLGCSLRHCARSVVDWTPLTPRELDWVKAHLAHCEYNLVDLSSQAGDNLTRTIGVGNGDSVTDLKKLKKHLCRVTQWQSYF